MRKKIYFLLVLVVPSLGCKHTHSTLFELLPSEKTGIDFNNQVIENDSINPLDMEFLYNGGGVAVGDFNRDGKPDLYFTASEVSNRLYLNQGNYRFKDVTMASGTGTKHKWSNAATVIDINNDGWLDIYVCCTNNKNPLMRENILYVNQGLNKEGVPVFKEMAKEYGLADTSYSVCAAFFDKDNDGDLDMFLVTTMPTTRSVVKFTGNDNSIPMPYRSKLYENTWNSKLGHPVFHDVSVKSGITYEGYGLGLTVADFNGDGYKDIYITNDFLSSDVLYINNGNGTFSNKIHSYFKHTSSNAMGNDYADINNDGLPDFVTVDMAAESNYRKKKNGGANNYNAFQNLINYGYMPQYARNTLQLNRGNRPGQNDSIGEPVFSEIGFLSGMAETDWSWSPLFADIDNDGYKDLLITNGYPKDVTDHDFAAYRSNAAPNTPKQDILDQLPSIKIPNYAFHNRGDLTFQNVTGDWGMTEPSFSSGAVYVDLTGSGHLDYVVNNINGKAFVYRNTLNDRAKGNNNHYLDISFAGQKSNVNGLGAIAELRYRHGQVQKMENAPNRGYLSCVDDKLHFGLGVVTRIDSLIITWPGGQRQLILNVPTDQRLTVYQKNAALPIPKNQLFQHQSIFRNITEDAGVNFYHHEDDFVDFDVQRLLPHKLSQSTPVLAVGDIDGNGTDDIYVGGSGGAEGAFLLQDAKGQFHQKPVRDVIPGYNRQMENTSALLIDICGTGKLDLLLANGSSENLYNHKLYQDKLYLNDGKGNFKENADALPVNETSKSCIRAADFNHDGKPDLFVGGRQVPGEYPKPAPSFIYRNDSHGGVAKYTDVTNDVAPFLKNIGMITDAIWTDFNNDGWIDLILVGEFMPVTFLENNHGKFQNITPNSGISNTRGCWTSIVAGDFSKTGRTDYIIGNMGLNLFYRVSPEHPMTVYGKDFDSNGSWDAIPTVFLKDQYGDYKEFPAFTRDDMIKQMIGIRRKFPTYKSFGEATLHDILSGDDLKGALTVKANEMRSCLLKNLGDGKFALIPLPVEAQFSPIYGMVADDFDGDGNMDVLISGNDYSVEVGSGRSDAGYGLLLRGDGKGGFRPASLLNSGFFYFGDGRALTALKGASGKYLVAASQNRGPLQIFDKRNDPKLFFADAHDVKAEFYDSSGKLNHREFYWGSSCGSQSSRMIILPANVRELSVSDDHNNTRKIIFK